MMLDSRLCARFHSLRCTISPCAQVGRNSVTRNFGWRGRQFGFSQRNPTRFLTLSELACQAVALCECPGESLHICSLAMRILTTVAEAHALSRSTRRVLVPTMGALHKGHAKLIRVAREHAGYDGEVAVSIFVNPLQFQPGGDYKRYPRPAEADEEFCRTAGVDLLFRPAAAEMYADNRSVFVEECSLSKTLE